MRTLNVLLISTLLCGISFALRSHAILEDSTYDMTPAVKEDMVAYVNSLKTTWTASTDQGPFFEGMTIAQAKRLMGARKSETSLPKKPSAKTQDLPDNFDVRQRWPQCASMFQIRDQSACGSCWAFSTAEAMSDRTCVTHNQNVTLSAAQINSCSNAGDGCNGGFPPEVWQYWVDNGIVTDTCSPYTLPSCDHHLTNSSNPCPSNDYPTPACVTTCSDSEIWSNSLHFGLSAYSFSSVDDIMLDILNYGSVQAAFDVYEDFLAYKSGVYHHVSGLYLGGHAVKVIGWGVDNGTPYWTVANSWNVHWGDKGFFKIQRGDDECGFEDAMNAGLPK